MTALERMRETFEMCTVMAGVEPDFECIYITKDAANVLFDEAEAEDKKLRELVRDALTTISWCTIGCYPSDNKKRELNDRARELGVEA